MSPHSTIIESIGVYLPQQSVPTSDVLAGCVSKIQFPLEKITGIKTRRVAGDAEFSIDLAKNAVADCLAKSKYLPADMDIVICCNISRYDAPNSVSFEPCTAVKLRKYFGFNNALVFDITNACAGMFTAIHIINAFIKTGAVRRGLVVSGEYITNLMKTAQREISGFMDLRLACLTLGDAGAALVLEKAADTNAGFRAIDLQTYGSYSQYCIAKASEHGGMIMFTDSVRLTDAAVISGAKHAIATLDQAGWPAGNFQHLIMHQTSTMTLNSARREINKLLKTEICHDGNTINNLSKRGNTASTAHFVALYDQILNNKINSGDKIVFSISASGLTIGTALYAFNDLPDRLRRAQSQVVEKSISVKHVREIGDPIVLVRIESLGTLAKQSCGDKKSLALLTSAATSCLEKSSYVCDEIDLLIYSGVYRDEYLLEPAYATLLAGELSMNAAPRASEKKTLAFDIFNGSVGFLNSCYVAQQMIASGAFKTVMITAAEIENNNGSFSGSRVHVSETASALILDAQPDANIGFARFLFNYHLESINAYISNFKTGDSVPCLEVSKDPGLEELYLKHILANIQALLILEGLDLFSVDIIFPPQISSFFIKRLSERLVLPLDRFIDIAGDGPDLFSSSIPYAFEHAYQEGLVKAGDVGLVIAVGSGIQVGCAIYYF